MKQKISVTIPVFNEEKNLYTLYQRLIQVLVSIDHEFEIIFVNDGSSDNSKSILNQIAEENPCVKVIHFTRNFGQTAAMMAGFDHADGEIIVPMDADLQNDPEDIPLLLAKLDEGYDLCSGWRKKRNDNMLRKKIVSRIANKLISKISRVNLKDYGCTLKAYRKSVIKGVKLYGEMHRFIPIYASWEGAKISEIPVRHHPRVHGKSSYGLERTYKVLLDLIVIVFLDNWVYKPIYLFGGFGLFNFFIAILAFSYATYLKFSKGIDYILTPLPLLTTMTVITGIMCILMGLLAEMIMRTYCEAQKKKAYLIRETRNIGKS
jgi:glycosyltransferase involved in cell wall biosynthesis